MFIAIVTGPFDESIQPTETILDLRSTTMEDARNELYALYGLIPGQQGYYDQKELGTAKIFEVTNTLQISEKDISSQVEESARLEAAAYAEAESAREMEQFNRSKKRHRK